MTRSSRYWRSARSAAVAAAWMIFATAPAVSQGDGETKVFENTRYNFTVALPAGCRHDEGPGTIDAICSADLDPKESATANKVSALVLQVSAETVADDAGRTASELAQQYGETAFKSEVPEVVCGEPDGARVKVENVKAVLEVARVVYTADVVCSEIRFLQIGERRASVRFLIGPAARYRLVARAPADAFSSQKALIDAFFASFDVTPAGR